VILTATLYDQEVQARFSVLRRKLTDLRPVMRDIGETYDKGVDERFRTQTDPDGVPWRPLRPATLRRKKGPSILTEKHRLRDSIHYQADQTSVTIGAGGSIPYAAIHQLGGPITMPGRQSVVHQKLMRRGKHKGKILFAKESKADRAMKVSHGGYKISIPARAYLAANRGNALALGGKDQQRVMQTLEAWLAEDGPLSSVP
jgi:phage virion morphogenesis protein